MTSNVEWTEAEGEIGDGEQMVKQLQQQKKQQQ